MAAPSVGQLLAVSFNAVINDKRKPANQWAENAAMREFQRQGIIQEKDLGYQIEHTLDYQPNPGTQFSSFSLDPYSLAETEVLTAALYDPGELVVPIVWTKKTEAQNPSMNQKVALVGSLIENALTSHDNAMEQAIFATSTNGWLGFGTHIPSSGLGTDGGIDATQQAWWRNPSNTYTDDTDIEAGMTLTWNQCGKGSGSDMNVTLIVSDGATQALFEGTQQAQQRYVDEEELKAGFKILAFKTSRYIYSQYGGTSLYFVSKKCYKIVVGKGFWRSRGDTQELPNATGCRTTMYSAGNTTTNNKSRNGILHL